MTRDNDIVRALGFVTLYAAYVEESVDMVMERLSPANNVTDRERRLPTSQKLRWCKTTLRMIGSGELDDLIELLNATTVLLERRNEVVHGRIYAGEERSDTLRAARAGSADRQVTADELYSLAEELFDLQATIPNIASFATWRALATASNDQ